MEEEDTSDSKGSDMETEVGDRMPNLPHLKGKWQNNRKHGVTSPPSEASSSAHYSSSSDAYYSAASNRSIKVKQPRSTEYTTLLQSKSLWPVNPAYEQNWSGRGQHAEFQASERKLIDSILQPEELLGSTNTAVVEKVRCKRILLARKKIRCNRVMTRDKAVDEVAHLTRLNHAHVVRVIGTYICGPELSILLYPVAQWNLSTLLEKETETLKLGGHPLWTARILTKFFKCLTNALAHIHESLTKHMDIKPQNILVKRWPPKDGGSSPEYRVYIADFGISRHYTSLSAADTEGPTSFTRKYAAPEVVDQERRGLPSDVFSMGCVFLEIAAVLYGHWCSLGLSHLTIKLGGAPERDTSYQANLAIVTRFLQELTDVTVPPPPWLNLYHVGLGDKEIIIEAIRRMISVDPAERPSAADLVERWGTRNCCTKGAEPLAAESAMADESISERPYKLTSNESANG